MMRTIVCGLWIGWYVVWMRSVGQALRTKWPPCLALGRQLALRLFTYLALETASSAAALPEQVARQLATVAGLGRRRPKPKKEEKPKMGQEGEDIVADETGGLPGCCGLAAGLVCVVLTGPAGPSPRRRRSPKWARRARTL